MTEKIEYPCVLQHLGGGSFSQARIAFANLTVVRRQPQAGGGILLTVTTDGRSVEFVLDEPARQALVEQLAIGFGTFSVRDRAERTGRDPRTGESMEIPATRNPSFKPGKGLREAVRG